MISKKKINFLGGKTLQIKCLYTLKAFDLPQSANYIRPNLMIQHRHPLHERGATEKIHKSRLY